MLKLCLMLLLFTSTAWAKPLEVPLRVESALLMNAKTGRVLFEKNGYEPLFPASTTKIATALLLLHKLEGKLDLTVTAERDSVASITAQAKKQSNYRAPAHWLETDGSHVGIRKGEEITYHDLLHMLLIASANDAANVIAQGICSSIPKFMEELNAFLKNIGCTDTFFCNPHGLHHPEHKTTAFDLALMTKEALKDPLFRQVVGLRRYTTRQTNLEFPRNLVQTNLLLKRGSHFYAKAIGVKTGTTQAAGKNLVAAASDEGRELIAVVLGHRGLRSELYQDITKLFESAFNEPKMRRVLLAEGPQKIQAKVPGAKGVLKTTLEERLCYEFYPAEESEVHISLHWQIPALPIPKGAVVGEITIVDDLNNVLGQAYLFAQEDLKAAFATRCKSWLSNGRKKEKILFALAATPLFLLLFRLRRKRA